MGSDNEQMVAHIAGRYSIATAIVGGLLAFLAAWFFMGRDPPAPVTTFKPVIADLVFSDISPRPQRVNKKRYPIRLTAAAEGVMGEVISSAEMSTYRFVVHNLSSRPITIRNCSLTIDRSRRAPIGVSTMAIITSMDHVGHSGFWIDRPEIGSSFLGPLDLTIPANQIQDFTIWFKAHVDSGHILYLLGRLKLEYNTGVVTSDPFEIEIHHDSEAMNYDENVDYSWPVSIKAN